MFDKLNRQTIPDKAMLSQYTRCKAWNLLVSYIEDTYQALHKIEYSGCSIPGWNLKYRKRGKSLCTLYPMEGYFICLIVINDKIAPLFEEHKQQFSHYVQDIYETTQHGMGQRWLMLEIEDEERLKDIKRLLEIRLQA